MLTVEKILPGAPVWDIPIQRPGVGSAGRLSFRAPRLYLPGRRPLTPPAPPRPRPRRGAPTGAWPPAAPPPALRPRDLSVRGDGGKWPPGVLRAPRCKPRSVHCPSCDGACGKARPLRRSCPQAGPRDGQCGGRLCAVTGRRRGRGPAGRGRGRVWGPRPGGPGAPAPALRSSPRWLRRRERLGLAAPAGRLRGWRGASGGRGGC